MAEPQVFTLCWWGLQLTWFRSMRGSFFICFITFYIFTLFLVRDFGIFYWWSHDGWRARSLSCGHLVLWWQGLQLVRGGGVESYCVEVEDAGLAPLL